MNRGIKVFMVIFVCFLASLILNTIDQTNIISGNWDTITSNVITLTGYLAMISLGLFYLLERGR